MSETTVPSPWLAVRVFVTPGPPPPHLRVSHHEVGLEVEGTPSLYGILALCV